MRQIEAVIFDMDGVLIDSERIITDCWNAIAKQENIANMKETITDCIGLNGNDTREYFYKKYGNDFDYDKFSTAVRAMYFEIIEKEGLPMKKGVHEILEYLKSQNYKIGLASSSHIDSVSRNIKAIGIYDYFEVVVAGNMVKHSKPQPDIYLKACKEIGVEPEKSMAIEDSPNGIRAGYGANMKVVMVPDLVPSTEEIRSMLFGEYESLLDLLEYFKQNDSL